MNGVRAPRPWSAGLSARQLTAGEGLSLLKERFHFVMFSFPT
jgi:hypothetical protein